MSSGLPSRIVATLVAAAAAAATASSSSSSSAPTGLLDATGTLWPAVEVAADADASVSFTVALQPSNLALVDQLVREVSDPDNAASYGKYLSPEEVSKLTAAHPAAVSRVLEALEPAECENRGDSLRCTAKRSEVDAIFRTKLGAFQHPTSEDDEVAFVAVEPLTIPAAARKDIVFVSGLTELPFNGAKLRHNVAVGSGSKGHSVVPDTIRLQYNVSEGPVTHAVPIAVAEFAGADFEKQSDLSLFSAATGLGNLTIDRYIGPPNNPQADPTEATLDIQYLASVGLGNTNWVWNSNDWMFTLASDLAAAATADRPTVVSVSYAWNEAQQCHGLPGSANCTGTDNAGYINRTNVEFQKAALLGTTVLVASGDSGAHGRTDESCVLNPKMHPDFPASSPFVTTVGGTQFSGDVNSSGVTSPICSTLQCAGSGYEVVASADARDGPEHSRISSGGGFSAYTPTPDFQKDAVAAYLSNGTGVPAAHLFNSEGRGYPDISALSHAYFIKINGETGGVDGTSAATPVIAGLVGRINAHRAEKGRPTVGFLNPLLYKVAAQYPEAFNDVTEGSNRCTESGCLCQTGFGAAVGWDAASGLGTPNFGLLLEAIDAIDDAREAASEN